MGNTKAFLLNKTIAFTDHTHTEYALVNHDHGNTYATKAYVDEMMSTAAGGSVATFTATWNNINIEEQYYRVYDNDAEAEVYYYYIVSDLYSFNYRNYISFNPSKIEVSIADTSPIKFVINTNNRSTLLENVTNPDSITGSVNSQLVTINGGASESVVTSRNYKLILSFTATDTLFKITAHAESTRDYDELLMTSIMGAQYNGFKAGSFPFTLKFII